MPHRQGHLLRGVGLMMLAVFMFSSMDTLAKHVLRSYPIPPLIWARYFIQSAFMVAVFGPRMGLGLVRTRHPVLQVVRGLLLVSSTVFFYLSLIYLPLAEAAAISFVGPVLVTALSGPLLKERVGPRQWLAVFLGFTGVLIIIRPGGAVFSPTVALPLLTAVFFSLYQIATRKVAGRDDPMTTLFFTALVGAVATTVPLPFTWQTPTPVQWLFIAAIGTLGGLGHFLLIRAVEHASPMALAPFVYVQLVWSTVLAWLVFGDFPDGGTLSGMGVIVMAGLLAVDWRRLRTPTPAGRR
jgi:drug/metabolite transporter (DMT)-like permease